MIDARDPNYACTPVALERPRFEYAPGSTPVAPSAPRPVVTVVTPFYNTGEIFHETAACVLGGAALGRRGGSALGRLERVAGQSLQNLEWIIVNDASTDRAALEVLEHYRALGAADPRIRVIDHARNHGLPATRNTGWRAARAPYVFFLDSDDLIEPTALEKCAMHLACNPEFAFVKGHTVGFGAQEYLWTRGFHDGRAMLEQNLVTATTMVRRRVLETVGGFDETIRGGLEDWEFWLRCAAIGHWGGTIPEPLDWYRRRARADDGPWTNLKTDEMHRRFRERLRAMHPGIFQDEFPRPQRPVHVPHADIPESAPFANALAKTKPRLLMIVPWFRMGGADRFNLDLLRQMVGAGWEVTIATTLAGSPWLADFARWTPDIFLLDHVAQPPHYPVLLRHLIDSRRPDVVMLSNSELAYLILPYLRHHCPDPVYADFNHMEEEYWKNGGHPRASAGAQDQLDLNIVASHHLKEWMVAPPRRADAGRIEVCYTCVDAESWKPDPKLRAKVREELDIAENTTVLLYPVRLTAQKQPMVFADAVRRLIDRAGPLAGGRPWVALVAGDGEDRPTLERYIREHGLGDFVRMLGARPFSEMHGLMAASDILFLPSMQEGIALSIFEAMAMGLTVVGAVVGGQAELVVPGTGYLLPLDEDKAEEAEAYARLLARLIADPAHRRAIGAAARARVAGEFRLEDMGRRMLELFELAKEHQRTAPRAAVSAGLAREIAMTGIDWVRTRDVCEALWPGYQRATEAAAEEQRRRDRARVAAEAALGHIEGSAGWRLVERCKRSPLFHLYAASRYGPDWRATHFEAEVDPEVRLARIRDSRTYRLVTAVKRLPPVSLVSRLRHGPDPKATMPELLRED